MSTFLPLGLTHWESYHSSEIRGRCSSASHSYSATIGSLLRQTDFIQIMIFGENIF